MNYHRTQGLKWVGTGRNCVLAVVIAGGTRSASVRPPCRDPRQAFQWGQSRLVSRAPLCLGSSWRCGLTICASLGISLVSLAN